MGVGSQLKDGEGPKMTGVKAGPGVQRRLHRCTVPSPGDRRTLDERRSGLGLMALPNVPAFWRWLDLKPQ